MPDDYNEAWFRKRRINSAEKLEVADLVEDDPAFPSDGKCTLLHIRGNKISRLTAKRTNPAEILGLIFLEQPEYFHINDRFYINFQGENLEYVVENPFNIRRVK